MLEEYLNRRKVSKTSTFLKSLQTTLSESEKDYELYSDLLSVEARDIYSTARLQLDSVNLLLNYRLMSDTQKSQKPESTKQVSDLNSYLLDIGGNIGFYARFFARLFTYVVTLEPNPKTFELLKLNTQNIDNIFALNLGASSQSGTKILRGSSLHSGGYKISNPSEIDDNGGGLVDEYEVRVVTYRDLMKHIQTELSFIRLQPSHPTVIKIDVEGHELEVLKGIDLEVFESLPSILLELNGSKESREELVDFLKKKNYTCFVTTTNLIVQGANSRFNKYRILYTIGGIRLVVKSFNKNSTVVLENPQLYRLEQLLVL
jgi:FkbM family methyltransferase